MKLKNGHVRRAIADAKRSLRHLEKLAKLDRYQGIPSDDQAFIRYRTNALVIALAGIIMRLHDLHRGGRSR